MSAIRVMNVHDPIAVIFSSSLMIACKLNIDAQYDIRANVPLCVNSVPFAVLELPCVNITRDNSTHLYRPLTLDAVFFSNSLLC